MSDMRATERLLEVIEEGALVDLTMPLGIAIRQHEEKHRYGPTSTLDDLVAVIAEVIAFEHGKILDAVTELRRRGDTLVRRDDLVRIIEKDDLRQAIEHHRYYDDEATEYAADIAAYDRLENAIGGKPR